MTQPLITVDAALHALASATTPDELINLANQAAAMQVYARRARLGMLAQNRCAEIRLRAERKLGELLTTTPRLHGRPKSVPDQNTYPSLSDLGVPDRKISHRAQKIAAVPAREFEAYLRDAKKFTWEITTRLLLHHCERRQATERNRQHIVGGRVDDLIKFARAGHRMGCIVIDPPWPIAGSVLPYMDLQVDDLKALPIGELAAERCHVHLWTLPTPIIGRPVRSSSIGDFASCRNSFGASRRLERAITGGCRTKSCLPLCGATMIGSTI